MRARLAWLLGGIGVAGVAAYRALRTTPQPAPAPPRPGPDPRAEELRQKLAESRTMVEEREEFESAETTVDEAPSPEPGLDDRRKRVHERGRAAARKMREPGAGEQW